MKAAEQSLLIQNHGIRTSDSCQHKTKSMVRHGLILQKMDFMTHDLKILLMV